MLFFTITRYFCITADNYLAKQYERIVLRPELTDADIQEAYIRCIKDIHSEFIEAIHKMEGDLMELLASETSHLSDPTSNNGNGKIVLRPELTDADIQEAYVKCIKDIHSEFIEAIHKMEGDLMELLASETSHLTDPTSNNGNGKVVLNLDWACQLQKIKNVPANFEKKPELTVALSAGGAILGKTIGTAVAGKAAAGTVGTKLLGGKLATPFVTKVHMKNP